MKRMVIAGLAALALGVAFAADRDPTLPPAEAGAAVAGAQASGTGGTTPGNSVIVQNGKPYLAVGTRLVAVGQKVGNARLERITETEIWLREDGQLRKLPRFGGIQRTVAKPPAACPAKRGGPSARPQRHAASTEPSESPQAVMPAARCDLAQP